MRRSVQTPDEMRKGSLSARRISRRTRRSRRSMLVAGCGWWIAGDRRAAVAIVCTARELLAQQIIPTVRTVVDHEAADREPRVEGAAKRGPRRVSPRDGLCLVLVLHRVDVRR